MARRHLTAKDRQRIFDAADGCCHICHGVIHVPGEAWEIEHVIAYALTCDDSDKNLRPAHKRCHQVKTHKVDRPAISKAERRKAKHEGSWPKPIGNARLHGRPFRPTRNFHQENSK